MFLPLGQNSAYVTTRSCTGSGLNSEVYLGLCAHALRGMKRGHGDGMVQDGGEQAASESGSIYLQRRSPWTGGCGIHSANLYMPVTILAAYILYNVALF
jgi:hypothetical protein